MFGSQLIQRIAGLATLSMVLCAPLLVEAKPFRHEFGELREYHKHWLAVCSDETKRRCRTVTATHTSEDGFFLRGRLAINQHWQTGDYTIQFIDEDQAFNQSTPVKVRFSNGKELTFNNDAIGPIERSIGELEFKTADAARQMLKHMRARNHMTVSIGKSRYFYSLMGVRSAMRFMKNHKKSLGEIAIHKADFWSGEWPNGFTVLKDVKLFAQTHPSVEASFTTPCSLKKGATYHPWNQERVKNDKLEFVSFQEIQKYRVTKNKTYRLERYSDREDVHVKFSKNSTWDFMAYFSEGLFLMSYKGQQYVGDQSVFEWSTLAQSPSYRQTVYEEWLGLPCDNNKRGWMRMLYIQGHLSLDGANVIEYGQAKDVVN